MHGLAEAPQLVYPAGGYFMPAPGSPLVDRGVLLEGINDDYYGSAPDIGALEQDDRCIFDMDNDGDVDGKDQANVITDFEDRLTDLLPSIAAEFGRTDCR